MSNPEKEKLQQRMSALPWVSRNAGVLTEDHVRFVTSVLATDNTSLERHIVTQVGKVTDDVVEYLPKVPDANIYTVTLEDITAIITRAAMTGAAQAASDIGESLAVIDR